MKSEWIDIIGDTEKAGIGGNSFFTGEYEGEPSTARSLSNTQDPQQWSEFWKEARGGEPPGPLPKGAFAIMLAECNPGDPTALEPESLVRNKNQIDVAWKRIHLARPGETPPKPRYAVLILPAFGNQTGSRNVLAWKEEQRRADEIAEVIREITEGASNKVTVGPVLRLKPRVAFLRVLRA